MRKDVGFKSKDGFCRGWHYIPDNKKGPFPVVIMAGGWCYVKEIVMPHYADIFVNAGFSVLIFDYRYLGTSDGEPRQHVNPHDQIEDYKNAISFVRTLPEVDPEKIAIWGISYSGGHVLIIGATDQRVKCIISNIPVIDGYKNMRRAHGTLGFRKLVATVQADRESRFKGNEPGYMPMTSKNYHEEVCTWPYPETNEIFLKIQQTEAPLHEHRNTIESVELLMNYSVYPYVNRILNTPTLMIVAENDDLTLWDLEIQAFKDITTSNKRLFVISETSHMALYDSRTKLEIAAEAATNWLKEHLG